MRFGTSVAAGLAALASACGSQSDYIAPAYVSPSTFEHLTCRQIGEEQKRITRAEATGGRLDGKPGVAVAILRAISNLGSSAILAINPRHRPNRAWQMTLQTPPLQEPSTRLYLDAWLSSKSPVDRLLLR